MKRLKFLCKVFIILLILLETLSAQDTLTIKEKKVRIEGKLELSNSLKSVNEKLFTSSSRYKPGDKVVYEVVLKNVGEGFLNKLEISSNLDNVKSYISGHDVKVPVLENIDISIKSSNPRTVITSKMGDNPRYIRKSVNFAPKSSVIFVISGMVSEKSLGSLNGLKFTAGTDVKTSKDLGSIGGSISGEKTLLSPENGIYKPGDKLEYMLAIKNSGLGYGRGITVQDLLSEVTSKREDKPYGRAFSNWKISYLGATKNSSKFKKYTYLKGDVLSGEDLNTKIDIGPGVEVQFLISADIDPSAIGVIESPAKIAGGESQSGTIYLKPEREYSENSKVERGIRVKMSSDKSDIKLGEVVAITVNVENSTDLDYKNLNLKNVVPRGFRYLESEFEDFNLTSRESYTKTYYLKATVGTSLGKNTFRTTVYKNGKNISNLAETNVEVRGDSLLNTATIIGKVIDEKTKAGIRGVILYTPSGIVVETDEYGRFHLPDEWSDKTFGENYSLKLDENSLPKSSKVISENPAVKRITPYSLTKFNFLVRTKEGSENSEEVGELETDKFEYSGTGFVEAYIGKNSEKPRGKYFGKMSYGDYKLKLYFDTEDKSTNRILEQNIGGENIYYSTYGDNSKTTKEVSTDGKLYLKLEHKESSFLWGRYSTDFTGSRFANYNAELYGLKGEYKEDDINVKVFVSTPEALYGHDEFLGTGGSLYFLKKHDIISSSQKVWVKIVDPETHVVHKIVYLVEGRDYEIDPFIGRIMLTSPLDGGGSTSEYAYLVVDYSYLPRAQESDSSNYGLKGTKVLNENIEVGVTSLHEARVKESYDLKSAELKIHDKKGNYIKGEISTSKGARNVDNYLSFDGGLSFQKIDKDVEKISGNAYRITGAYKLLEVADLKVWYERKERGYSFAEDLGDRFYETFGTEFQYEHSEKLKSYTKLQFIDSTSWGLEHERKASISTRLEYLLNESTKLYGELKAGINETILLGAEKRITDRFKINSTGTFQNSGIGSAFRGDYGVHKDYKIYSGYSFDGEIDRNKYTVGQMARVGERTSLYAENQYITERGKNASLQSYGFDFDYKSGVIVGGSIQYGEIVLPDDSTHRRRGFSLYSRAELKNINLKNKFEYREDRGDDEIKQYVLSNSLDYKYSEEYSFKMKINYHFTEELSQNSYFESSLGLAYRPIHNDRLNYLARYVTILDRDSGTNRDFSAYIGEFESIYSFTENFDFAFKNGYRREKDVYLNDLYMLGLKADYTIFNSWKVYGQYQWLLDRANEDVLNGAIFGIYKNIDKNIQVGGGYNFSGFKDSLGEQDYKVDGWFFNIIGSM